MDDYGVYEDVCITPAAVTQPGSNIVLCGASMQYDLVDQEGTVSGTVYMFQDGSFGLYVTFVVYCPYILRSVRAETLCPLLSVVSCTCTCRGPGGLSGRARSRSRCGFDCPVVGSGGYKALNLMAFCRSQQS